MIPITSFPTPKFLDLVLPHIREGKIAYVEDIAERSCSSCRNFQWSQCQKASSCSCSGVIILPPFAYVFKTFFFLCNANTPPYIYSASLLLCYFFCFLSLNLLLNLSRYQIFESEQLIWNILFKQIGLGIYSGLLIRIMHVDSEISTQKPLPCQA